MKKRIVFGIIAAFALLFVLPGCSDPSNAIPLEKLPGPGSLKATAYEGMNLLTWTGVVDAASYDVYRIDPVTRQETHLTRGNSLSRNFYKDWVSFRNELADGVTYEYMVVANSAKSTAISNAGLAVQNGVSRVKVKAIIPTTLTAPELAETITTKTYASDVNNPDNKDMLVVTVSNAQPNYMYNIAYTYGSGENLINRTFGSIASDWTTGRNYLADKIVAIFPVIGGTNSVIVTASFGAFEDGYYNDTDNIISATAGGTYVAPLAAVTGFNADRNAGETGIKLTWNNVTDATSYDVYKIAISNDVTGITDSDVTVTGDWAKITGTPIFDNGGLSPLNKWVLSDVNASGTGYYAYAIIANGAGGTKSDVRFTTESQISVAGFAPAMNISSIVDNDIEITFTKTADVTYTLDYVEIASMSPDTNASFGDFKQVDGTSYKDVEIPTGTGSVTVEVDNIPTGKNYLFRLSATYKGVTTTDNQKSYVILAQTGTDFDVE